MLKQLFGSDGGARLHRRSRLTAPPAEESAAGPLAPGAFSESMKMDWAKGLLSSSQVQQYCAAAVLEGNSSPAVQALASVGNAGGHASHAQRDIMRKLGRPLGSTDLHFAETFIRNTNGEKVYKFHPFLLPHESFAKLFAEQHA